MLFRFYQEPFKNYKMDEAATRTMLGRFDFTNEAAHRIADAGHQGLNRLTDMAELTDEDVTSICYNVRRPGGTVQDANGNQVQDRGSNISFLAEQKLKYVVYFIKHRGRCSDAVAFGDVVPDNVNAIKPLYQEEKVHKDPDMTEAKDLIDKKDWNKTFENIDEYIGKFNGIQGTPLLYLCRETIEPQDNPADGWATERLRMIGRAPHTALVNGQPVPTATYKTDNTKLWDIILAITRDQGDVWTYAKAGKATKDGRLAYLTVRRHYLGANFQETQKAFHENRIRSTQYHGEKRKMDFKKYSTMIFDSIQALNAMKADGYQGVDGRSAVRYLLDGIKDDSLDATKNTIFASQDLRGDFDQCVALFQDFITSRKANDKTSLNISETNSEKNQNGKRFQGGHKAGKKGPSGVEYRYYKTAEYLKLSPDQKEDLRQWRQSRNNGLSKEPPTKKRKSEIKAVATEVVEQLKDLQLSDGKKVTFEDNEEGEQTNATNKHLTRQNGKRGDKK